MTDRGPRLTRHPGRLVAFSDAVFAIAVTLLVLEIQPPEDFAHLLRGLGALWSSYLAYALSFLLIGQVWVNHHVMFDRIRHVNREVLFLNLFNIIWARLRRAKLLDPTLGPVGTKAIGRRFAIALVWIGAGIVVGAFVPIAGVVIIAGFLPAYYLPIRGEYGQDTEAV